jgi:23S rRNA (cytosine1962-C5)-methyltransferase
VVEEGPPFSPGAEVLDGFCYTGAFGIYAAYHGAARVTFVDSSGPARGLARENLSLNGFSQDDYEFVEGDAKSLWPL